MCSSDLETLLPVVVSGFSQQPLMLLTNMAAARDSSTLWWIVEIYLTRWKIEETFRTIRMEAP